MANPDCSHQIDIQLDNIQYPIFIGEGILYDINYWRPYIASNQLMLISNETVGPLYASRLLDLFSNDYDCQSFFLKDGEAYKNLQSLEQIFDHLIDSGQRRDTTIIALGGGVVTDISGFAASCYQRGVPYIQAPTSLLAQVDAAVGGKTAINHPAGKNMIGSFYQPQAVISDVSLLSSLPQRQLQAGFAEIIKYALLDSQSFLDKIQLISSSGLQAISSRQWMELIASCCQIKAAYVIEDEKEQGIRALLNLGHTLAHALEAMGGYQRWLHGEAVAMGLYFALLLSCRLGFANASLLSQLVSLFNQVGLSYKLPAGIDLLQVKKTMLLDKKNRQGESNFILIENAGKCFKYSQVSDKLIMQTLMDALDGD